MMNITRYALSAAIAALLAGCGGSQPPLGAPGAMAQPYSIARHSIRGSWMLPEAKGHDLLYASAVQSATVSVFTYPGGKQVGELTGFASGYYPQGLCSDKAGDVFVTTAQNTVPFQSLIYKFAHGGTNQIETLSDPGEAQGCATDPTSGNLAVTNLTTNDFEGSGDVVIYPNASGAPTAYADSNIEAFIYCTYDMSGNLFLTVTKDSDVPSLVELTHGSGNFTSVGLTKSFLPGSVQWVADGLAIAAVTVSHNGPATVYQVQVSGSTGTVTGSTVLQTKRNRNIRGPQQYWVQGSTIVSPYYYGGVAFWPYPKGGRPAKVAHAHAGFIGVTVSVLPH